MSKFLQSLAVLALALFAGCATYPGTATTVRDDGSVAAAPAATAEVYTVEDYAGTYKCVRLPDGRGEVTFTGPAPKEFQLYGGARIRLVAPVSPGKYIIPAGDHWFNFTHQVAGKWYFEYVPDVLGDDGRPVRNYKGSGCGIMVDRELGGRARHGAALMIGDPGAVVYSGVTSAAAAPLAAAAPANTGAAQNCNCDKPAAPKKLHKLMKKPKTNTPPPCPPGCVADPAAPAK